MVPLADGASHFGISSFSGWRNGSPGMAAAELAIQRTKIGAAEKATPTMPVVPVHPRARTIWAIASISSRSGERTRMPKSPMAAAKMPSIGVA